MVRDKFAARSCVRNGCSVKTPSWKRRRRNHPGGLSWSGLRWVHMQFIYKQFMVDRSIRQGNSIYVQSGHSGMQWCWDVVAGQCTCALISVSLQRCATFEWPKGWVTHSVVALEPVLFTSFFFTVPAGEMFQKTEWQVTREPRKMG